MNTKYRIDSFGRIYLSNGPSYGWKGAIGGLSADNVLRQIEHHAQREESLRITRERDEVVIPVDKFKAGTR